MIKPVGERVASLEAYNQTTMSMIEKIQNSVEETKELVIRHVATEEEDRKEFKEEIGKIEKIVNDFISGADNKYALQASLEKYDKAAAFYTKLKWSLYIIGGIVGAISGLFSNVIASFIYDFITKK